MKTVLIIAYEYSPYNRPGSTIGAQRPFQFAKNLPKFGWRPIIICSEFKGRHSIKRSENWPALIKQIVEKEVKTQSFQNILTIPLPSLSYDNYFDKKWLQTIEHNPEDGSIIELPGYITKLKRKFLTLLKYFQGDHSQSWQPVAIHAVETLLQNGIKIDILIAEHSPNASLFIGKVLNKKYNIPWIIDFRDPFLLGVNKWISYFYTSFIRQLCKTASAIINVTPNWVELDQKVFNNQDCYLITNGFDESEYKIIDRSSEHMELALYYFGSVKKGQSFSLLLHAINLLYMKKDPTFEKIKLEYNGPSYGIVEKEIKGICPNLNFSVGKSIKREKALSKAKSCDLLILLSKKDNSPFYKNGFYPGKVFEYLGLNKFFIVIPGDKGLLDQLTVETKSGKSFDNIIDLANFLRNSVNEKLSGRFPKSIPTELSMQYKRSELTKKLAEILDKKAYLDG